MCVFRVIKNVINSLWFSHKIVFSYFGDSSIASKLVRILFSMHFCSYNMIIIMLYEAFLN